MGLIKSAVREVSIWKKGFNFVMSNKYPTQLNSLFNTYTILKMLGKFI